jgi:DNA-binding XRE family transcriptional regulator
MDEHGKRPNPRYLDGDKLRAARIAAALDQSELAAMVGIDRSSVAHHEAGDWGCHMRQLKAYAQATGVKPQALMLDSALRPANRAKTARALTQALKAA